MVPIGLCKVEKSKRFFSTTIDSSRYRERERERGRGRERQAGKELKVHLSRFAASMATSRFGRRLERSQGGCAKAAATVLLFLALLQSNAAVAHAKTEAELVFHEGDSPCTGQVSAKRKTGRERDREK